MLKPETHTYLISTFWGDPFSPNPSLGVLKGYLDRNLPRKHDVTCLQADLTLLHATYGQNLYKAYNDVHQLHYESFTWALYHGKKISRPPCRWFEAKYAQRLAAASIDWLKTSLIPALETDPSQQTILGFTLSFPQLYHSLYLCRELARLRPDLAQKTLFVFGGVGLEFAQTQNVLDREFRRHKLKGFSIHGEGELQLQRFIQSYKKFSSAKHRGVKIVNLKPAKDFAITMSALGVPDFDAYFTTRRQISFKDPGMEKVFHEAHIRIPIEGSRGCASSCDFCFKTPEQKKPRVLSGREVYAKTAAILKRYPIARFAYSDSYTNRWINEFCDCVEKNGWFFPPGMSKVFMEMKPRHDFQTLKRIARCGFTDIETGVESFSPDFLAKVRKGHQVIHNLQSLKFQAELGLTTHGNFMLDHPKLSLDDLRWNQNILKLIPHFPQLKFAHFRLFPETPICKSLSTKEQSKLKILNPLGLRPNSADDVFCYVYQKPKKMSCSKEVLEAGARFKRWYFRQSKHQRSLNLYRQSRTQVRIEDTRSGRKHTVSYSGLQAQILLQCHEPQSLQELEQSLKTQTPVLNKALQPLLDRGLVIHINNLYLTLALETWHKTKIKSRRHFRP